MKKLLLAFLLLPLFFVATTGAQSAAYLDPNSPFSPEFTAALQKKKVPVVVTTDPANAQYLVNFTLANNDGSIVQGIASVLTTGSYQTGAWDRATIQVVDAHSKDVVFSYTCKKYNQNSGDPTKSVAECLAKHWKDQLGK